MRELTWMYQGFDRQRWMYTAAINSTQAAAAGSKNETIEKNHPYMKDEAHKIRKQKLLEMQKRMTNDKGNNKN